MLIDARSHEDFVKEFKKKFESFCERVPLLLSYTIDPLGCIVEELNSNEKKKFIFDYAQSVFENIKQIREWLINNKYPVMTEVNNQTKDLIKWRIEKVNVRKDQFVVRNLSTDSLCLYRIKMPSTIFLKRFREGRWDEFEAFTVFKRKSVFVHVID